MMRNAVLLAAVIALLRAGPCLAQTEAPVSGIRVQVDTAAVTDLDCSGRSFKLENTQHAARWYVYMAHGMRTPDWDPRPVVMGVLGCALLAPVTVLAVPVDLLAAPFRRQCDFRLEVGGTLGGWAGQGVADTPVEAYGANLLQSEVEGVSAPVLYRSSASAVSDGAGRFSLSIPGHVGRSKDFIVRWKVKGLNASGIRVGKRGGRFELEEDESEFGTSLRFEESGPRLIVPQGKKK